VTYCKLMKRLSITTLICLVLSAAFPTILALQLVTGLGIFAIVMLMSAKDIAERGVNK
jgi:lysylphosphatidylglycerol synthetase-like protein (DUF2156 family)